eukprot:15176689-Alexandrium_andersonii.AAC.1
MCPPGSRREEGDAARAQPELSVPGRSDQANLIPQPSTPSRAELRLGQDSSWPYQWDGGNERKAWLQ